MGLPWALCGGRARGLEAFLLVKQGHQGQVPPRRLGTLCVFSPLEEPAFWLQVLSRRWATPCALKPTTAEVLSRVPLDFTQYHDAGSSSVSGSETDAVLRGRVVALLSTDLPGSVPGRRGHMVKGDHPFQKEHGAVQHLHSLRAEGK